VERKKRLETSLPRHRNEDENYANNSLIIYTQLAHEVRWYVVKQEIYAQYNSSNAFPSCPLIILKNHKNSGKL
jgi:hypothetical protein